MGVEGLKQTTSAFSLGIFFSLTAVKKREASQFVRGQLRLAAAAGLARFPGLRHCSAVLSRRTRTSNALGAE